MKIFALRESRGLAQAIARQAGEELAELEERAFEGGEFKLRPLACVRGRAAFVVQSLAGANGVSPSEALLRLLLLCLGLRDGGASAVIAVTPYLAFARKDRRTQPRDPVTARYVAQLIEAAGVAQVVALDVHNPAAFDNAFRIPAAHLSAQPLLAAHLCRDVDSSGLIVASPDVGGIKRAQLFRELLERRTGANVGIAFIEKRRAAGRVSGGAVVGEVGGRRVLVLDDLCATGGTLVRAAGILRAAGAQRIEVAVTHAPLPAGLAAVLAAPDVARVLVTDSVARDDFPADPKLEVVPVARLLASAMRRIARSEALTPLLEHWPPRD